MGFDMLQRCWKRLHCTGCPHVVKGVHFTPETKQKENKQKQNMPFKTVVCHLTVATTRHHPISHTGKITGQFSPNTSF